MNKELKSDGSNLVHAQTVTSEEKLQFLKKATDTTSNKEMLYKLMEDRLKKEGYKGA